MTITLLQARLLIMFKSVRDYFAKEMKYLQALAGIFALGIISIFYTKDSERIKL